MNDLTTIPTTPSLGKKSRPTALLGNGNGKPARQEARHVHAKNAQEVKTRRILAAMVAFREGDFSARLPTDWEGIEGEIAEAFNQTIDRKESMLKEVTRLSSIVGKEGRLKQRMSVPGAVGSWAADSEC